MKSSNALNTQQLRYDEPGTAFSRVISEMPFISRCSDDKTATLTRPREYAIRYPYCQINRKDMESWLIFDLDHKNPGIWEDQNLPAPNLIVINRQNQHSHLFYAIHPVCTSTKARSGPIAYMKAVYEAMASALRADPSYRGPVAKTPGHPWWQTTELHTHVYDLAELEKFVELPSKGWGGTPKLSEVSHSRHCMMFEKLRYYAYSIVNRERETGTFENFSRLLEAYANAHNSFKKMGFQMNLTTAQVKATVKSVARWTWDRYQGGGTQCRRGIMRADKNKPLSERQSDSARRTHEVRKRATLELIHKACANLRQCGKQATQAAIATITQLSRQTIAKYLPEALRPIPEKHDQPVELALSTAVVKNAVYQIATGLGGVAVFEVPEVGRVVELVASRQSKSSGPP